MPAVATLSIPASLAARGFVLRPEEARDEPALRRLFIDERVPIFAMMPLPPEQKTAMLDAQFDYQRRHYRTIDGAHDPLVLTMGDGAIGRLYLVRQSAHWRLVDILLAQHVRGAGVGGALIAALVEAAGACDAVVRLQVDKGNPARRLYERMGFVVEADAEIAWHMVRHP